MSNFENSSFTEKVIFEVRLVEITRKYPIFFKYFANEKYLRAKILIK